MKRVLYALVLHWVDTTEVEVGRWVGDGAKARVESSTELRMYVCETVGCGNVFYAQACEVKLLRFLSSSSNSGRTSYV